jgi:hypothetical protein
MSYFLGGSVVTIKSERAKELLLNPKAYNLYPLSQMRRYPGDEMNLWVRVEREGQNVKNLSFGGQLLDHEKVILEAIAILIKGKKIFSLDMLSLRECEAYLRDRNSEVSLENIDANEEAKLRKILLWIRAMPDENGPQEYHFSSKMGAFRDLKLIDKVRELKAFLSSHEVRALYQGSLSPELIDIDDMTVYIQAPYTSDEEKALFEELHILGVGTFNEENLNFIPEG